MTSRAAWLGLFAGYFLLQALIRVLVGPALELDEAEAFWFARELHLGYNAQPPLYFWLQWVFFQVFGEGILALALLKAVLLWAAHAVLFLWLSRHVNVVQAGVAVLALGLLPQIVWESQRALTHSVLAFAVSVWFVVVLHKFLERGRWTETVLLGATIGLGIISKYNFALLPAGFLLWLTVSREGRRVDWRRLSVALVIGGAIVAPIAVWALANPGLAGASVRKLGLEEAGFLVSRAEGLLSLGVGLVSFLALAILVFGSLWLARERRAALRPEVVRYLVGGVVVSLVLIVIGIVATGATEVRDRWLLPVVWPLVPAAVLWLWQVLGPKQRRGLGITVALCWVVALVALPYASLRNPGYRAADFAALERAMAEMDPAPDMITSTAIWVMGNLVLRNPDMPIVWAMKESGPGLLLVGTGQGVDTAARLGLDAGQPIVHRIPRGIHVTEVEIVPVTSP